MRSRCRTPWAALVALLLAGCPGGDADDSADATDGDGAADAGPAADASPCPTLRLDNVLVEERNRQGVSAIAGAVHSPICTWVGAHGIADREAMENVVAGDRFRVGSITKTFTAAVVLQLVDEGKLSLDDPLSDWVAFPAGETILVRHLLAHTSGIYNYTDSQALLDDLTRVWMPAELVALAAAEPLAFTPGAEWSYSNTNYVLLGLIIEAETGLPYHEAVRARLLDPLGLEDTWLEGPESDAAGFVPGYVHQGESFFDITATIHPSAAWAAGAMISTTADLDAWAAQLFAGDVLSAEMRAALTTNVTLTDGMAAPWGLGVFVGPSPAGVFYAHDGAINGFRAMFAWFPERDLALSALINDGEGDPNAVLAETLTALGLL